MGYLSRVFHASEEANRRAILRAAAAPDAAAACSTSARTAATSRRGWPSTLGAERVAGVELIERHAAVARSRGIDVAVADLDEGIPFPSESFDVVHANQVIEHVRRTDVFLREIRRVLKPDGLACISTNNLASWHNVLSLGLGHAADADARERRDHRRQPAQPREPLGPPRPRPHAPAPVHGARAHRAGRLPRPGHGAVPDRGLLPAAAAAGPRRRRASTRCTEPSSSAYSARSSARTWSLYVPQGRGRRPSA